jgi:competence protein ComEA
MNDRFRNWLLYPKQERRAIIALCLLIALVFIAPRAYYILRPAPILAPVDSTWIMQLGLYDETYIDTLGFDADTASHTFAIKPFDPNTITTREWIGMGLSERQAAVIEKYKAHGGHFWRPTDLAKIYVLDSMDKVRLIPFVRIADREETPFLAPLDMRHYQIEINTGDSAAFEALNGIGPVYAARIVRYRLALGGYCTVSQISEVWGLPDSTYRKIKSHLTVNSKLIHRMNINLTDVETMRNHPYLRAGLAKKIAIYVKNNGAVETLESIKDIPAVTDSIYQRISPYLSVD